MGIPIAECFVSPQGEGTHTGRLMIFLRLAGCTVGTRYSAERYTYEMGVDKGIEFGGGSVQFPMLPEYTNECHLYDGRTFACDTDYKRKLVAKSENDLHRYLEDVHATCKTICLTGGEPLMHKQNFHMLVDWLKHGNYSLHLETSGTIPINEEMRNSLLRFEHISVSPKLGFLEEYCKFSQDIKLLIDENFNASKLPDGLFRMWTEKQYADEEVGMYADPNIFLQPVNGEHTVNEANLKLCLDYQKAHPHLLLSTQAHKSWSVR